MVCSVSMYFLLRAEVIIHDYYADNWAVHPMLQLALSDRLTIRQLYYLAVVRQTC